jgi:hypothetical protein
MIPSGRGWDRTVLESADAPNHAQMLVNIESLAYSMSATSLCLGQCWW